MESEVASIPKLDFSRQELGTTAVWDALQGQVMHALESYGCFEVEYDRVTPELRDVLFGRALPELFGLPLDVKMLNKSNLIFGGYVGQVPGWAYESLRLQEDVEKFTRMLWPQGNPTFCNTVSTYSKHMKDLEQIIVRMLFLGLDIEKHYESYIESTNYGTRVSDYGIPLNQESNNDMKAHLNQESNNDMKAHLDRNLISIICQHVVGGLEIQTKGGEWIPVVPSPNSYTVIIGEAMQVWTNGRLQSPLHRVRTIGNGRRYSIISISAPKEGCIIQTPKELVDGEHPLVYKPYLYQDHLLYCYSGQGGRSGSTLYDFCGIRQEEQQP